MTPTIIRQLWSVVEATQSNTLLRLDDASLVQWLLKQTKTEATLDQNETYVLRDYIYSRLTLIREIAHERQTAWQQ